MENIRHNVSWEESPEANTVSDIEFRDVGDIKSDAIIDAKLQKGKERFYKISEISDNAEVNPNEKDELFCLLIDTEPREASQEISLKPTMQKTSTKGSVDIMGLHFGEKVFRFTPEFQQTAHESALREILDESNGTLDDFKKRLAGCSRIWEQNFKKAWCKKHKKEVNAESDGHYYQEVKKIMEDLRSQENENWLNIKYPDKKTIIEHSNGTLSEGDISRIKKLDRVRRKLLSKDFDDVTSEKFHKYIRQIDYALNLLEFRKSRSNNPRMQACAEKVLGMEADLYLDSRDIRKMRDLDNKTLKDIIKQSGLECAKIYTTRIEGPEKAWNLEELRERARLKDQYDEYKGLDSEVCEAMKNLARIAKRHKMPLPDAIIEVFSERTKLKWKHDLVKARIGHAPIGYILMLEKQWKESLGNNKREEKRQEAITKQSKQALKALKSKAKEQWLSDAPDGDIYILPTGIVVLTKDNQGFQKGIHISDLALEQEQQELWQNAWRSSSAAYFEQQEKAVRRAVNAKIQYDSLALPEESVTSHLEELKETYHFATAKDYINLETGYINENADAEDLKTLEHILPIYNKFISHVDFASPSAVSLEALKTNARQFAKGATDSFSNIIIFSECADGVSIKPKPIGRLLGNGRQDKFMQTLTTCIAFNLFCNLSQERVDEFVNLTSDKNQISMESFYQFSRKTEKNAKKRQEVVSRSLFAQQFANYIQGKSVEPFTSFFKSIEKS